MAATNRMKSYLCVTQTSPQKILEERYIHLSVKNIYVIIPISAGKN